MGKRSGLHNVKLPTTQRLSTPTTREEILATIDNISKDVIRVIAKSSESSQRKEELANFFIFILNIIDIEKERIEFDRIKQLKIAQKAQKNT